MMAVVIVMAVLMVIAHAFSRIWGNGSKGQRHAIGLAGAGALPFTEIATLRQALHVVVVTVLGGPHLGFKAEHLGSVLTQGAIHVGVAADHLLHPLHEGVEHARRLGQVAGVHEGELGVVSRHPLRMLADATHQHPGKQEIGEYHQAPEAQFDGVAQAWLHEWEGDSRVDGLPPAKAKTLHQHPGHLGHIGVGIGVRRTAAHHHQQAFVEGYWLLA